MSRFPRLTETFVVSEIVHAQRLGITVGVYPLLRERAGLVQPETADVMPAVRYTPVLSLPVLRSQLYWLRRYPRRYIGALVAIVKGTWGSFNFFVGGLGIFPKVAHMARLMAEDGVEHVHCHFANHPALAGFVVQRLTGIGYSFTAHAFDIYVDRHMLREKVAEASFVVAISEYGRRIVLDECGDEYDDKVRVIHCGIDIDLFSPAGRREGSEELSVLCVGTLAPWKGQRYLIDACARLVRRGVDVRCIFVGGAGDARSLEQHADALGLGDRIRLVGWKTRPEVAQLMRDATVVVTPSVPANGKYEGIPVCLMEAMASGTPVVASRLGGIPELVEDGVSGLLVPPGDADALAEALERLHGSTELRRSLAEVGRRKVAGEFDLASNAAELVRRIRSLAPSGS